MPSASAVKTAQLHTTGWQSMGVTASKCIFPSFFPTPPSIPDPHEMAPRREKNKIIEWFWSLFSSKDAMCYMPDGPQRHTRPGGFFKNAQQSTVQNSTMNSVQGNQYNMFTNAQEDHNIVTRIMSLLSKHIIPGAAHDSSPREPPPRCHPGTRVKLIARITTWFENQASLELLLWITGPAGVGKSAIVQTFAEYLAKCKLLGASVFISRPNKRDNPHGIFITIAYQLATRIEAYRAYIIERVSCDPELLRGGMQAQFMAFIVEPFVEKKIGTGGKRWGILLDGLDELRGKNAQCEIIQTISTFVREHRDAPLVWIIGSRPESHISNTFEDDEIRRSYWSEYVPIDSPEVCQDVERFLRSSFGTTQKKFRHSVDSNWPSDTDFLKVTAAASGLFIYAEVVMQFIRDFDYADPVSRLEVLISVIERSNAVPTKENPFVHLDALYNEILSSIPSVVWPTTKQLLGVAIYGAHIQLGWFKDKLRANFLTLRGTSVLFGITRNAVYVSLDKSRSTLMIPDWKVAHKEPLTFLHASFSDFLKDSSRSGEFHIGSEEGIREDVELRLLETWSKCNGDDIRRIEAIWHQSCSKLDDKSPPSSDIKEFYTSLFDDTMFHLGGMMPNILCKPMGSPAYASLRKVHMRKLCYFFKSEELTDFVHGVTCVSRKPHHIRVLREVRLRDLEFGHLDWKLGEMSPAYGRHSKISEKSGMVHRPRSSSELKAFVSDLQSLQDRSPELQVVIIGGVPRERVAVFRTLSSMKLSYSNEDIIHYVIPYPE
ncbi:hypothetical protein AGABI1DRAFT_130574 [Agaricus bisporus var. burnettii JB137-S8]|uniref:Nephrocystin 3-like N-terminal domain-containing protein n=1 Tax=Agaricus bisporus var. burnettii (strain JB137-S8 / ATCC MYA-4627 / FGSC 10392) TaxID=597362 RepID=K5X2N3_AGABU|nr:uncharacterized protein AGABI1DRAFT_130574 [Agaricus bisporus var. burnettii JB137-S8]EKM77157.1 hypothetical protein AGABI1DRAFT_130574 [Agaricus bisporus var. burnettii JB137-S8]